MIELAQQVGAALKARGLKLVTAESCTGGWVAMALTAVPGSSDWFERGYVTYSNAAKREDLGVREASEDDLYAAMDWLLDRQPKIEAALAARHQRF